MAIDGQFRARLADIDIVPSFLGLFSHLHLMTLSQQQQQQQQLLAGRERTRALTLCSQSETKKYSNSTCFSAEISNNNNVVNFQNFLIKFCRIIAILFGIFSCKLRLSRLTFSYFIMKRAGIQFFSGTRCRSIIRTATGNLCTQLLLLIL